jgi:hypothetical protein
VPQRRQTFEDSSRSLSSGLLSGNVIVSELLRNMEAGRFEMAYSVLLPCVFTVYLNPDDYAVLRGVFDLVIDDARKALRARVAGWNRPALAAGRRKRGTAKEYKIACREWQLEFLPDAEVASGDLEIHSQLSEKVPPGFRGTRTTLLGGEPSVTRELKPESISPGQLLVYAAIHYEDETGPQTYLVRQNHTRIGRGGDGQPVDLALRATDEISRQHLIIRRDPASGAFSVIDASTNGTWIDGRRLAKGVEAPLPARARISLGEVVTLLFEARV